MIAVIQIFVFNLFLFSSVGLAKTMGADFGCPKASDFPVADTKFEYRPQTGGSVILFCPAQKEWNGLKIEINLSRLIYSETYLAENNVIKCVGLVQDWDFDQAKPEFPRRESEGLVHAGKLIQRRTTTFKSIKTKKGMRVEKPTIEFLGAAKDVRPLERAKMLREHCDKRINANDSKTVEDTSPGILDLSSFAPTH